MLLLPPHTFSVAAARCGAAAGGASPAIAPATTSTTRRRRRAVAPFSAAGDRSGKHGQTVAAEGNTTTASTSSSRIVAAARPPSSSSPPPPPRESRAPGHFAASAAAAAATLAVVLTAAPGAALAGNGREVIGSFEASGLLFKDSVEVTALDDRDVPGVTLFISDFKRSLADKLAKDFFSEPSQASLTCAASPAAAVAQGADLGGTDGKELFSERKTLSFIKDKTLRVRRVWDPSRRTLVYVAYSTRLVSDSDRTSSGRYRTSICAVQLPAPAPAVAAAAE